MPLLLKCDSSSKADTNANRLEENPADSSSFLRKTEFVFSRPETTYCKIVICYDLRNLIKKIFEQEIKVR